MTSADRYARQRVLPEIGAQGQRRLGESSAVIVGLGALGCVSADLLARAGVGRLRLVDRDVVELGNLQRQTLYSESDVDRPKAEAARDRLAAVNGSIDLEAVAKDVHALSVRDVIRGADVIVDGTDNLETRYLLNEAALDDHRPFVYGGAIGTYGMVLAIRSPETACLRCLYPTVPAPGSLPTCETAGVLNAVSVQVAAIQAGETLRLLLGQAPSGDLIAVEGWKPGIDRIHLARNEACATCVGGQREFLGARRTEVLASLCGSETISLDPLRKAQVDLTALEARLRTIGSAHRLGGVLVADIEGHHLTVFGDGRALLGGVRDASQARALYAKYVGV